MTFYDQMTVIGWLSANGHFRLVC